MSDEFVPFPKIARFSREVIVTEKIDGTNASIWVGKDGSIRAGSRNRFITPGDDNFGFAHWVEKNAAELAQLGPGVHFGEWWGAGIQRKYGLSEKRFSLFNVRRWGESRPACCSVVPVLWRGNFDDLDLNEVLRNLTLGSHAAPGFTKPEGVVIFHVAGGHLLKKTIDRDDEPKGAVR